jgi:hypothetical protein
MQLSITQALYLATWQALLKSASQDAKLVVGAKQTVLNQEARQSP